MRILPSFLTKASNLPIPFLETNTDLYVVCSSRRAESSGRVRSVTPQIDGFVPQIRQSKDLRSLKYCWYCRQFLQIQYAQCACRIGIFLTPTECRYRKARPVQQTARIAQALP